MKCEIIRDLLPLYADGLVSDVTKDTIVEHTAQCGDCRELMKKMCVSVEEEPHAEDLALVNGLKRHRKKARVRTVLACAATALACLLCWWMYMETHFVMSRSVVVETDGERILGERPELALTAEEKALSDLILALPVVREQTQSGDTAAIPAHRMPEEVARILPEDGEMTEVAVLQGANVSVDYRRGEIRTIIEYLDPDRDGGVDLIRKTVGVRRSPDTWEADTVYTLEYVVALNQTWYEKTVSEHVWFGFLQMP